VTETHAGLRASTPPPPPRLVTITDACRQLQISRTFLYRLLDRGELRSVKLGRVRRIPAGDLDELVARRLRDDDAP
jgi:excisionase family DNA binding protein